MATWTFTCWSCRNPTVMEDKVTRREECPHCGSDMRSCKNCHYYDPGAHNECSETISEYVPDKERANLCGMYRTFVGERAPNDDASDAKARLEALFRR